MSIELSPDSPVEDWYTLAHIVTNCVLTETKLAGVVADNPSLDLEDLHQEAVAYHAQRADTWDKSLGEYASFAWMNMYGAIKNFLDRKLTGFSAEQYAEPVAPLEATHTEYLDDDDLHFLWDTVRTDVADASPELDALGLRQQLQSLAYVTLTPDDATMVLANNGMLSDDYTEHSTYELAQLMGVDQSTVVRRLHRSLELLRHNRGLQELNELYGCNHRVRTTVFG